VLVDGKLVDLRPEARNMPSDACCPPAPLDFIRGSLRHDFARALFQVPLDGCGGALCEAGLAAAFRAKVRRHPAHLFQKEVPVGAPVRRGGRRLQLQLRLGAGSSVGSPHRERIKFSQQCRSSRFVIASGGRPRTAGADGTA